MNRYLKLFCVLCGVFLSSAVFALLLSKHSIISGEIISKKPSLSSYVNSKSTGDPVNANFILEREGSFDPSLFTPQFSDKEKLLEAGLFNIPTAFDSNAPVIWDAGYAPHSGLRPLSNGFSGGGILSGSGGGGSGSSSGGSSSSSTGAGGSSGGSRANNDTKSAGFGAIPKQLTPANVYANLPVGVDNADKKSIKYSQVSEVDDVSPAPVPLPAAFWLFASGMVYLVGYGWRRRS